MDPLADSGGAVMRVSRVAAGLVLMLGIAGCGGGEGSGSSADNSSAAALMPDVVGLTLDVALSDIKRAGIDGEVEVLGGGAFGVVDESNWTVCTQLPAAGAEIGSAPRVTVDRSCPGAAPESTTPTTDESEPTTAPEGTDATQTVPPTAEPTAGEILTAENNADFAALLQGPGECDESVSDFATKYEGQTIEFDGNVAYIAPHGGYDTRFDFLIYAGDYSESAVPGPSFRFTDENYYDLNLTGPSIPDSISQGANLRFTAIVGEFTEGCLLLLEPVSTRVR